MSEDQKTKYVFVIGFPKCATTSIWLALYNNKEVAMVKREPPSRGIRSDLNDLKRDSKKTTFGFKQPMLIYDVSTLRVIVEEYPDAKYIISVRDPIKWLQSFYFYRREEFIDFAQRNPDEAKKHWLNGIISQEKAKNYVEKVSFEKMIYENEPFFDVKIEMGKFEHYIKNFTRMLENHGHSKVMIVSVEKFKQDSAQFGQQILEFFELSVSAQSVDLFNNKSNVGKIKDKCAVSDEVKIYLENYYRDTYKYLESL